MRFHAQEAEVDWETVPRSERPEGLWIAGECWRREGRGGKGEGVTLVVTHANGFTKEVGPKPALIFLRGCIPPNAWN
jgi:hypothetical protein